jgi:hypothetical protein
MGRPGGVRWTHVEAHKLFVDSARGYFFCATAEVAAQLDLDLADAPRRPVELGGRRLRPLVRATTRSEITPPDEWNALLLALPGGAPLQLLRSSTYRTSCLFLVPADTTDLLVAMELDTHVDDLGVTFSEIVDRAMRNPLVSSTRERGGAVGALLSLRSEAIRARKSSAEHHELFYWWYDPAQRAGLID